MEQMNDIDVLKNLRTIEWLKCEILTSIADLYKLLARGEMDMRDDLEELVSNTLLLTLLLGKRLGLEYKDINSSLIDKIKLNMLENHKIEKWYGDLGELMELLHNK